MKRILNEHDSLINITAEEIKEEPEQEILVSPKTLKKLN